jgi:hypothetical protein
MDPPPLGDDELREAAPAAGEADEAQDAQTL